MKRQLIVLIFSSIALVACNAFAQPTPTAIPPLPPTMAKPSIAAPTATLPPAPPGTPTIAPVPLATATRVNVATLIPPLTATPTPASKRIRFAAGATATTVQGNLATNAIDTYVLRAFAGQTLTVDVASTQGKMLLSINGADGQVYKSMSVGTANFSVALPATQDYFIAIAAEAGASANFTLQVSIPPLPTVDPRPTPKRISFAPGGTTAIVQGNLATSVPDMYVLRVSGGQVMAVRLVEAQGRAVIEVSGADGTMLVPGRAQATNSSGNVPFTQDYFIEVIPLGTPVVYSLQVTIPPLNLVPIRIAFQPGATSAIVQGLVAPNATDRYMLRALAGQTMTIKLLSPNNQAVLAVWGEDGQVLVPDQADATNWKSKLPATQDYIIDVWSIANANVGYSLHIDVPPR